jgi:hypothetical protein
LAQDWQERGGGKGIGGNTQVVEFTVVEKRGADGQGFQKPGSLLEIEEPAFEGEVQVNGTQEEGVMDTPGLMIEANSHEARIGLFEEAIEALKLGVEDV